MTLRTITFDDEQWQVVPKKMAPVMWHAAIAADDAIGAWVAALANAPEPPAQEPEPAAYMYQHDETGRTTFREPHERMNERRWQEFPLYRHLPSEEPKPDTDIDALLDCAEALRWLLQDTQHAEHECGDQTCPVAAARAALARLNGDDNA